MKRPAALVSLVSAVLALGLTGCSDDGSEPAASEPAGQEATTATLDAFEDAFASRWEAAATMEGAEVAVSDPLVGLDALRDVVIRRQTMDSGKVSKVQVCTGADGGSMERRLVFRLIERPAYDDLGDVERNRC